MNTIATYAVPMEGNSSGETFGLAVLAALNTQLAYKDKAPHLHYIERMPEAWVLEFAVIEMTRDGKYRAGSNIRISARASESWAAKVEALPGEEGEYADSTWVKRVATVFEQQCNLTWLFWSRPVK